MFADVADKPPTGAHVLLWEPARACVGTIAGAPTRKIVRGLGLNMANNPKKVKDPTEVALSAIQEALNIGEQGAENRNAIADDIAPPSLPPATPPDFNAGVFEPRGN